jgi:hypothetical protein
MEEGTEEVTEDLVMDTIEAVTGMEDMDTGVTDGVEAAIITMVMVPGLLLFMYRQFTFFLRHLFTFSRLLFFIKSLRFPSEPFILIV